MAKSSFQLNINNTNHYLSAGTNALSPSGPILWFWDWLFILFVVHWNPHPFHLEKLVAQCFRASHWSINAFILKTLRRAEIRQNDRDLSVKQRLKKKIKSAAKEEEALGHSCSECVCVCVSGLVTEVHPACSAACHLSLLINNTLHPQRTPACVSFTCSIFFLSLRRQCHPVGLSLTLIPPPLLSVCLMSYNNTYRQPYIPFSSFHPCVTSTLPFFRHAIIKCLDLFPKC